MNKPKICVPIRFGNLQKGIDSIKEAVNDDRVDLLELWLDELPDVENFFMNFGNIIKDLLKNDEIQGNKLLLHEAYAAISRESGNDVDTGNRVFQPIPGKRFVIVNKAENERGRFNAGEKERISRLILALKYNPDFVDVGIDTETSLINKVIEVKGETGIILSFHDFEKTPQSKQLLSILEKMRQFGPELVKFAVRVERLDDIYEIFSLLGRLRGINQKFVVTGMGKMGKILRIMSPFLGSEFVFACLREDEMTADGQMSVDDLREIWGMI